MLGKLTMEALPLSNPIEMGASVFMVIAGLTVVALVTYFKAWEMALDGLAHQRRS